MTELIIKRKFYTDAHIHTLKKNLTESVSLEPRTRIIMKQDFCISPAVLQPHSWIEISLARVLNTLL